MSRLGRDQVRERMHVLFTFDRAVTFRRGDAVGFDRETGEVHKLVSVSRGRRRRRRG